MKRFVITKRCEYMGDLLAKDFVEAYQLLKEHLLAEKFYDPKTEECELVYVDKIPALHITKETTLERFYLNEEISFEIA